MIKTFVWQYDYVIKVNDKVANEVEDTGAVSQTDVQAWATKDMLQLPAAEAVFKNLKIKPSASA